MDDLHTKLVNQQGGYSKWHQFPLHGVFHWLFFLVVALSATFLLSNSISEYSALTVASVPDSQSSVTDEGSGDAPSIPELTQVMLDTARDLRKASPDKKAELTALLVSIAKQRSELLSAESSKNPKAMLDNAINTTLRARMPKDVLAFVEQKKSVKGKFEYVHADYFDEDKTVAEFFVTEQGTGKRYKVNIHGSPKALTDDTVTINGYLLAETVTAAESDVQVLASITPSVQKKIAVILFNFQNDTRQPFTTAFAKGVAFTNPTSASKYYSEASFGKWELRGGVNVDGDVYGWVTIPYNSASTSAECNHSTWSSAARQMVAAAGADLNGITNFVYAFPKNACAWSGIATVGGDRTVLNGGFAIGTLSHELGHNFTLRHASTNNCTEGGVRVSISNSCTISEYGDPFDIMGQSGSMKHVSGYNKGKSATAWVTNPNKLTIDRTTHPDNTYTLYPIEQSSGGLQVLRTVQTGGNYYYIDFRQTFGYDNYSSTNPAVQGVMIRLASDYSGGSNTKLIDTTPATTAFTDAPLLVGQSFYDPMLNMTVTTVAVSSSSAQVRVAFGPVPCNPVSPTVTISPSSQSGAPGTTLSYNVTVKNNDNSTCTPTTFVVTPTLPAGFTQSPANFTTVALNPGGSVTTAVNITSSDTTAANSYQIVQRATHQGNTTLYGTQGATYVVVTPDVTAPVVAITSPLNGSSVGTKGKLNIAATASDNTGVTRIELYVDSTLVKTCTNSISCSGSATLAKLSPGGHTVKAIARDAAGNQGISQATFQVQ